MSEPVFRLSKLSIRDVAERSDYASSEVLLESLQTLRGSYNIPIQQYIRDLVEKRVDAISFTKDTPYYYFFARRLEDNIAVTLKEAKRVIEFSLPLQQAQSLIA